VARIGVADGEVSRSVRREWTRAEHGPGQRERTGAKHRPGRKSSGGPEARPSGHDLASSLLRSIAPTYVIAATSIPTMTSL